MLNLKIAETMMELGKWQGAQMRKFVMADPVIPMTKDWWKMDNCWVIKELWR